MSAYWSYLLTAVGVTGLYLAGRKLWWSWLIGLGAQVLWFAYAVATRQWGFIVSCFAYGWVYARNARAWHGSRVHESCQRFHPGAECIPGDNHPAVSS